jgi:FkbM family methyltransferase
MPAYERLASALIGTPLQRPAERLRRLSHLWHRCRHPELREILDESRQIDRLLAHVITDGMNCIDVGCHLGSMLSEIVRLSSHGHHIAFEPVPYKAAWLRKKFPNVDVRQVALSDFQGQATFYINSQSSGHSGLRHNPAAGASATINVDLTRLDDIVPDDCRIGFLKVDVEGVEYRVFCGARRVLNQSRPIVLFECTQAGLANAGSNAEQVHNLFTQEFSYHIYVIGDWLTKATPLEISAFAAAMNYPFRAFNFVAVPRDR